MTYSADPYHEDQRPYVDAIEAAIDASEQYLGPRGLHRYPNQDLDCEDEPIPTQQLVLSEWVTLVAWVDPETGGVWTTKMTKPGMPAHHVQGLLGQYME